MKNTYDRLIDASIEIIYENGYLGTSISMLADKVGISKSTVMYYFSNKEKILLRILENFLPVYIEAFKPILNDTRLSGLDKLNRFLHFHMKMVAERKDVLAINLMNTKYLTGINKTRYQNQQRTYEEQVVTIIRQIQKEDNDLFKNMNLNIAAKGVLGMCNNASGWYKHDGSVSIDDIAEQFFAMLTRR